MTRRNRSAVSGRFTTPEDAAADPERHVAEAVKRRPIMTNPDRRFLLHHTAEGRPGLCADDDPNPPGPERIIAVVPFEAAVALMDDIHETLEDCVRRDGGPHDED